MTAVLAAALTYIAKGWNPTPVEFRKKKPVFAAWQTRRVTAADAPLAFPKPDLNIGLVLGAPSNGLADIDLDAPEARAVGPYLLPSSPAVFGRASSLGSHWLYVTDIANDPAAPATLNFDDPKMRGKGARLLEVRIGGTRGAQTVAPPSIHESGEEIRWANGKDLDPPTVPGVELRAAASKVAAAALLARYWPQGTGMHNASRLLGGVLARAGWTIGEIGLFAEAIARASNDPDIKDRIRTAKDAGEASLQGTPVQGLPTMERTFGAEVTDVLVKWLGLRTSPYRAAQPQGAQKPAPPRPTLQLSVNLMAFAEEVENAIIAAEQPVYARDSLLVRPLLIPHWDRKTLVGKFVEVPVPFLRGVMDETADFERFDARAKDYVPCKPPGDVAELILTRAGRWRFPSVSGILQCQSMRADGSLILDPGHDPATGLYLLDPPRLPQLPSLPTREDAERALALLLELLKEFPFRSQTDRSVALAALLTAVVRPALDRVPMFAFSAPDAGSGKSYLVHCCAAIATGHSAPAITAGREDELEKRLGAMLIDGSPIILVDNVTGTLKSDFLCVAIEQPKVKIRILGLSKTIDVEPRGTIFATGNNLEVGGDVVRRTILCQLDSKLANPWERTFESKPFELIRADRGKYVAAALTVCLAFHRSKTDRVTPSLASFESWSDLVRSALVWLKQPDPVETIKDLRANDGDREAAEAVIDAWVSAFGLTNTDGAPIEKTAAEAAEAANKRDLGLFVRPELHRALAVVALGRKSGEVDPIRLGYWLRANRDKIFDGHVFRRGKHSRAGTLWHVFKL